MKHSDVQESFSTGAKRDTQVGKLRFDLISPMALQRLAVIYAKGAEHYGDRNWEKGMPFSRVMASLQRHLFAFILGDTSEDHLAQMVWNGIALLHFQEAMRHGLLDGKLNDMPNYQAIAKIPAPTEPGPAPYEEYIKIIDGKTVYMSERKYFEPDYNSVLAKEDYNGLVSLGCPPRIAAQIVGGTTYAAPDSLNRIQKYVYIAGPMRGFEKFNFPAFDTARDAFTGRGFNVISPADIDRFDNKNAEDTTQDVSDQTRFVLRDFWANFFLKKQGNAANGIVLLDGWQKSTGASGEFFLDRWLGLKAYKPDGTAYPIDNAKHDFALAHALAINNPSVRLLQCAMEQPVLQPAVEKASKYDGDWDRSDGYRGCGHFYRVAGETATSISYETGKPASLSISFDLAKERIACGSWTRLGTSDVAYANCLNR